MKITLVIPIYNGASTISQTLDSLRRQSRGFDQLIIIDDASRDPSYNVLKDYLNKHPIGNCQIIRHKSPTGLAANYNQGIRLARNDLVVTVHQDIIARRDALAKLVAPIEKGQSNIVATTHVVLHPKKVWKNYCFWQKVFFARLVGNKYSGLDGKFDCFNKSAFKKIGLFDSLHFRTAGEDGEMISRLKRAGKIVQTKAEIVHLHHGDNKFGIANIIKKQAQYSEAQGVLLRRGAINTPGQVVRAFFRELLLLALLVPYLKFVALITIAVYAFYYSKTIFMEEWKNPRIFLVPFLNIFLLLVSFVYSVRGLIYGKQKI